MPLDTSYALVGMKRTNPYVCDEEPEYKKSFPESEKLANDIEEYDRNDFYPDGMPKNRCLECGEDMGPHNPRQLCGKTMCYNK